MSNKPLINFLFELGQLQRIKHEGFRLAGVESPPSIAEHSLRSAQIAYFLAKMEGYDNPHEVVSMCIFHDIGEARVGDIHKVANRYVDADEIQAVKDQLSPIENSKDILRLWKECEDTSSTAGTIAKDADRLETAIAAKEYVEKGYKSTEDWINNVRKLLKTDSAKNLLDEMAEMKSTDWWQDLKKI